jgi:3-oxoadipate enol-lactonase
MVGANSRACFVGPELEAAVDGWIALFEQEDGPVKRLQATWAGLVNAACRESATGRAAYDAWTRVLARVPGSSLSAVARGMTRFDLRGRLASLHIPVLVIAGEEDRLFRPDQTREIAAEIAQASFTVIPGAGHLSNLDSADLFNRRLLDFLARHFPAGP